MSATETTRQLSRADEVCTTVALAVADATETPVDELPPLYSVIDPDALNDIFQPRNGDRPPAGTHVSFVIAGCTVSIRDGAVVVSPGTETADDRTASARASAN
ncbi:hypothetical protein JMJ58_08670 [Haloterrigena salifodinae]|uniref:Halobacterial output domain-containing protein n=1 Tax=Haloterrigena salifodinae TaxID=2675099 RepID=A0A8T8E639_9EURY|nr:HalOD1 output domain-containing protein [Haloterrigena salifodinae]QRV16922.1 hypothetical protein JMJ58_08670 [Haloterrigena salifodinae]